MAIQFILGASGTGKSNYIYDRIIQESMGETYGSILFVLPEQSNMVAEQDMVSMHPQGGTMDISILSFTRLAFKVFDELNVHTNDVLDDYGKSMLLMKILKEKENELTYYKNMLGKSGFVDEVKSVLSEFYQYQITEDVLTRTIADLSPDKSLYHKLTDLKLILHAFNEAMEGSYMVTEQLLSMLKEVAHQSKMLQNAEIYFDGFTGFTPVQYDVIEELMKVGSNLYFSFTMDENLFGDNGYSEQGLFAIAKQSVDRLCQLAQRNQIPVLPHVGMNKNHRLEDSKELLHLERQIFRFPMKSYDKSIEDIMLVNCLDSKQECMYIAKTIREYVMQKGFHYNDFAIVTSDIREQADNWRRIMELLHIPYFLDYTEVLAHNPVVEFVELVMEVFRKDFSYDSVFSLLKTGFFDVNFEDIYNLENYALKYGVKGYTWWSKAFRGRVKGLHAINETRKQFMFCIEPMVQVFQKTQAQTKKYLQALYDFMSTNKLAERLYERSLVLEEEGNLREAKAYRQAYDKFVAVLDKTMDILGEEEIARDDFVDVLLTGMSDVKLGVIPSTLDQVVIGDIERTRLHHVKVVFLAGVNEGILPKNTSNKGILADKDRRRLKDMNIVLAPDSKTELFVQQFYIYLQMAQAKQQLIVSFRQSDGKGAELRPSYLVSRMQYIFPAIQVVEAKASLQDSLPNTKEELIAEFARQLAEEDMKDGSVYSLMQKENATDTVKILDGYLYNNQAGVLNQAIARKLYGNQMLHSVSRLETYVGCAYKFFLQYGLKLIKREEYAVESSNIGTILHAVMETFFKRVKAGEIELSSASKEQLDQVVEQLTFDAAKEENETIFESSARNRHQLDVMVRIAKRSIDNLCRHLAKGEMEPAYFEEYFSPESKLSYIDMALSDGVKMELNGIVDRVDIKETADAVYVKVIDYKSGAKDIDYVKIYEGKQLQLTVYMSVMLELLKREYPDKRIIPTGMYYYHIYDPIVEEVDEQAIKIQRVKDSRLSGLVNDSQISRDLMDAGTGEVTPVNYKADGSLGARNSSLVTTEELLRISEFVREKMIDIGEDMIQGNIAMNPEKGEHNSPCNFCDYKSICRFEAGIGGNAYRIGSQLDKEEAKHRILASNEEEDVSSEGGENA